MQINDRAKHLMSRCIEDARALGSKDVDAVAAELFKARWPAVEAATEAVLCPSRLRWEGTKRA